MVGVPALLSRATRVTRKVAALNIIFENLWEVVRDEVRYDNHYCLNSVMQNGNIRIREQKVYRVSDSRIQMQICLCLVSINAAGCTAHESKTVTDEEAIRDDHSNFYCIIAIEQ